MMRLEHPRCAVMVEVLDQYTQIQRRLEPYLARYYQAMANDPVYNDWVSDFIYFVSLFVFLLLGQLFLACILLWSGCLSKHHIYGSSGV